MSVYPDAIRALRVKQAREVLPTTIAETVIQHIVAPTFDILELDTYVNALCDDVANIVMAKALDENTERNKREVDEWLATKRTFLPPK